MELPSRENVLVTAYHPGWVWARAGLLGAFWAAWSAALVAAFVLMVTAPQCEDQHRTRGWWSNGLMYRVYLLSFQDGNGDGVGDLAGVRARLDYLSTLGVSTVWLPPIFDSPMKDFGFDVRDYTQVSPVFGDIAELRALLRALEDKGMKLVLDMVPNHTSDQHDWFARSVQREEPYKDYYVWAEARGRGPEGEPLPPNNWRSVFGGSAWQWNASRGQFYLHQFLKEQPDLNYRNPAVLQEMKDVVRHWLQLGVHGVHLSAAEYLLEDERLQDEPELDVEEQDSYAALQHSYTFSQPGVEHIVQEMREAVDSVVDGVPRLLMVQLDRTSGRMYQLVDNVSHPAAHLVLGRPLLSNPTNLTVEVVAKEVEEQVAYTGGWLDCDHYTPRVASRLTSRLVDALNMMVMLLPGVAVTYYGEELGMRNGQVSWRESQDILAVRASPADYLQVSRDPQRCPMQWSAERNGGFSRANRTWLPVAADYVTVNVRAQQTATKSHLKVYEQLVRLRRSESGRLGDLAVHVLQNSVLAFTLVKQGHPGHLVAVNFQNETVTVDLGSVPYVPAEATMYCSSEETLPKFSGRMRTDQFEMPPSAAVVLTFIPDVHQRPTS